MNNRMAEKLVENIRRVCREKGISIMRMENDLGFSTGLISRWSKTKTCPSFDKIVDIMEYLGVTYDEIMGEAEGAPVRKQEKSADNEYADDRVVAQLEKGSVSGNIEWERAGRNIPFKLEAALFFPDMFCYDMHRAYYAMYKSGWFLFSVQYNEETADVCTMVYMLAAVGADMVKLDVHEERTMKLLKLIDEELFERINQIQTDRMREDFLKEDFQNRYISVS